MPSLRKLIVIDSYAASRIREVRLDGHVHVAGRNGRGKTTLIRLIPLFYGEQPSRVVRSSGSVVRSLREFMFSRSTSYVAFEYENHDGIKLAILHYGSDNSPQYHLADGPYAKDIFVENGQLIEGRHLNARLRTLGRNPSGALGVLQYRAIIQGTTARLASSEKPLARRFALVAARSRLAGIERISSGMFSKDISFVALKRMAASVARDEEDNEIVLKLSRKELEGFLPDFKAYQAVMALEPNFQAANSAYVQGGVAHHHQARAAGKLKCFVLALGRLHETLRKKTFEAEEALSNLQREQREAMAAFDFEAEMIAGEITRLDDEIERANQEEKNWSNQNIQDLMDLVARRTALEKQVADLQARQTELLAKADSVTNKYKALFAKEEVRRNQLEADAQARLNATIGELNQETENLSAERETAMATIEDAQEIEIDTASEAWLTATKNVSTIDQALAQLVPDAELAELARNAWKSHEASTDALGLAKEKRAEALLTLKQAENRLTQQIQCATQLAQKHAQAKDRHSHLLLLENPGHDTLLHYLRAHSLGWHANIAKVMREDLLLRTDLSPDASGQDDSLYGLTLDLARIEAGRAASEQSLATEIARAKAVEEDALRALNEVEREKLTLTKAKEAAHELHSNQDAECSRCIGNQEHCRQTAIAAEKRRDEELGQRRSQLNAQRKEASAVVLSRKQAMEDLKQSHLQAKLAARSDFDQRAKRLRSRQQMAKEQHAEELAQLEAAKRKALKGLEELRLSELTQAGVDTAALKVLEEELATATQLTERARQSASTVESYQRWRKHVPALREEHKRQRQQKVAETEALQRRRQEQTAQFEARIENQQAACKTAQQDADSARLRLEDAEAAQRARLAGIEADIAEESDEVAVHWLLPEILTEMDAATTRLREQERLLTQHLGILVGTFRKLEYASTKVGEYAAHIADDHRSEVRHTLDVFGDWYSTAHTQQRDVLAGALRNGCGILRRFQEGLLGFQSSIKGLSTELQNSLDSGLVFEAIRKLSLRLSALVERRPYWDALGRVLTEHDRWQEAGFSDLPSPALLEELQDFARHLPEGELAENPETLMDLEIEVDDGTEVKRVRNETDLKQVSSNGLSYLVLCLIFVAFANRARRNNEAADIWLTWALDEIGTIDEGNSKALLAMLNRNRIRLVSASPEAKESLQTLFDHHYEVLPGFEIRRILREDELPDLAAETADEY